MESIVVYIVKTVDGDWSVDEAKRLAIERIGQKFRPKFVVWG